MPRSGQFIFSVLLLASAAGLVYGLLPQNRTEAVGPAREKTVTAAAASAPVEEKPLAVEELFEPPPLSEFLEITARPLFSPSRRPALLSTEDKGLPDISPVAGVPVEKHQFMVMGIVIAQGEKVALIKQLKRGNEVIRVKEGQKLSEWTVSAITPESVTLQQRGVTDLVKLSDNVLTGAEKRKLVLKAKQDRLKAAKKIANQRRMQSVAGRQKGPRVIPEKQSERRIRKSRKLRTEN